MISIGMSISVEPYPGHIFSNIYSMAFRLLRICSTEKIFEKRLSELKNQCLLPRNYHSKVIDSQLKRVRNLHGENFKEKRTLSLKKKPRTKETSDRVIDQ